MNCFSECKVKNIPALTRYHALTSLIYFSPHFGRRRRLNPKAFNVFHSTQQQLPLFSNYLYQGIRPQILLSSDSDLGAPEKNAKVVLPDLLWNHDTVPASAQPGKVLRHPMHLMKGETVFRKYWQLSRGNKFELRK